MSAYPARCVPLNTDRGRNDRLIIVDDPNLGEVTVRWNLGREVPWRCGECGPSAEATCVHTFSAALLLAETLLGLKRIPELNPTTT